MIEVVLYEANLTCFPVPCRATRILRFLPAKTRRFRSAETLRWSFPPMHPMLNRLPADHCREEVSSIVLKIAKPYGARAQPTQHRSHRRAAILMLLANKSRSFVIARGRRLLTREI